MRAGPTLLREGIEELLRHTSAAPGTPTERRRVSPSIGASRGVRFGAMDTEYWRVSRDPVLCPGHGVRQEGRESRERTTVLQWSEGDWRFSSWTLRATSISRRSSLALYGFARKRLSCGKSSERGRT